MSTPVSEIDLRPGGVFRTVMRAPDGAETRCTTRVLRWSATDRAKHEQLGFHQGWGESLDRLEALVPRRT